MALVNCNCVIEFEWVLVLNPMMGNTENVKDFHYASLESLKADYNSNLVDSYREEGSNMFGPEPKMYNKSFRKDSKFEWCNPLLASEWESPNYHGHGVHKVIKAVTNVVELNEIY